MRPSMSGPRAAPRGPLQACYRRCVVAQVWRSAAHACRHAQCAGGTPASFEAPAPPPALAPVSPPLDLQLHRGWQGPAVLCRYTLSRLGVSSAASSLAYRVVCVRVCVCVFVCVAGQAFCESEVRLDEPMATVTLSKIFLWSPPTPQHHRPISPPLPPSSHHLHRNPRRDLFHSPHRNCHPLQDHLSLTSPPPNPHPRPRAAHPKRPRPWETCTVYVQVKGWAGLCLLRRPPAVRVCKGDLTAPLERPPAAQSRSFASIYLSPPPAPPSPPSHPSQSRSFSLSGAMPHGLACRLSQVGVVLSRADPSQNGAHAARAPPAGAHLPPV